MLKINELKRLVRQALVKEGLTEDYIKQNFGTDLRQKVVWEAAYQDICKNADTPVTKSAPVPPADSNPLAGTQESTELVEEAEITCLTVQQPWAWAIFHAGKDIENRSWNTSFRGELYIHAGKKIDKEGVKWIEEHLEIQLPKTFETGVVLGSVKLTDVYQGHESIWSMTGQENWEIKEPVLLNKPIPAKGKLSFWKLKVKDELLTPLSSCKKLVNHIGNQATKGKVIPLFSPSKMNNNVNQKSVNKSTLSEKEMVYLLHLFAYTDYSKKKSIRGAALEKEIPTRYRGNFTETLKDLIENNLVKPVTKSKERLLEPRPLIENGIVKTMSELGIRLTNSGLCSLSSSLQKQKYKVNFVPSKKVINALLKLLYLSGENKGLTQGSIDICKNADTPVTKSAPVPPADSNPLAGTQESTELVEEAEITCLTVQQPWVWAINNGNNSEKDNNKSSQNSDNSNIPLNSNLTRSRASDLSSSETIDYDETEKIQSTMQNILGRNVPISTIEMKRIIDGYNQAAEEKNNQRQSRKLCASLYSDK